VPEHKPERIAAVVVTFNRKQLLGECVDSLLGQTHPFDALYVIDNNSTDGTYESLLERQWISPIEHREDRPQETVRSIHPPRWSAPLEVHYVHIPENTGGANGFVEAMRWPAAAGFDWLWLMDDDVLVAPDALEALLRAKSRLERSAHAPFVLNCLVLARDHADPDALAFPLRELSASGSPRMGRFHWRLSEVCDRVRDGLYLWICPFNGTFLPARVVAEVGLPRAEFYMQGAEIDWQFRAAKTFALYTVIESRVFHPRLRLGVVDWKYYYLIRNMFVVNRNFSFTALRNFRMIVVSLIWGIRHGRRGTRLVLRAIRDGLAGRLGKRDDLQR
jgi:rhamnopyranosyl-N-acetylglucosaminyl-diphospho-decaprenol beta-1,3/1,4-galactofuranosyltransferase